MSDPYLTVKDLESVPMTHARGGLFNPPGLTNFWGACQAAEDLSGIQHLTFPPYSMGDAVLGGLTVNGCCIRTSGVAVTYRWRPDRILREASVDGLRLVSRAAMRPCSQSIGICVSVRNPGTSSRTVSLRLQTGEGVIRSATGWKTPFSPRERGAASGAPWEGTPPPEPVNRRIEFPDGSGVMVKSSTSLSLCLQAAEPKPKRIDRSFLDYELELRPGEEWKVHFLAVIGPDPEGLKREHAQWRKDPEEIHRMAERDWNHEIEAAFTPGNDRFSGHLPRLVTSNRDLMALYHMSVFSALYFKREHPDSAYGRTYTTLMPRYWATTSFINDWSLAAPLMALLDPECLKRHILMWLERDIYHHFGTEYVSGTNAGNWYSCNDFAMTRLISAYLRWTGDLAFLEEPAGERTVLDHLKRLALHGKDLDRGSGLGDYGDRNSLLECVGSYVHEVASLNMAQAWVLREVAHILDLSGDEDMAAEFRKDASDLARRTLKLYVPGRGHFACRHPDGTEVPVRHAWDFVHVLNFAREDLSPKQVEEMVGFFVRELQTPSWMRALSGLDEDVDFTLRPDHQWNGCYPGWVGLAGTALREAGRKDLLRAWIPGLARSANQGPYSQAHFIETYAAAEDGGARKAPTDLPYINDWAISSAGTFFETVLRGVFGTEPGFSRLEARPELQGLDERARLEGLSWHGKDHAVDASGVRAV